MRKLYLSRDEGKSAKLVQSLRKSGFLVSCQSQIKREPIHFSEVEASDWIFFSSPQAVEFFFSQTESIPQAKFGAIGPGTAKVLNEFVKVNFTGQHSDTLETAREFKLAIGNATVLFPSPEKGLRTVQNELKPSQYKELICYRTLPEPKKVSPADIYIFTSPSNVKAFATVNEFPQESIYYAFGKSTVAALQDVGVGKIELPYTFDEDDLFRAIFSKFVS